MKIKLINVGRSNKNVTIEIPDTKNKDLIELAVIREAKKHLVSLEVDATLKGSIGEIYSGFFTVGIFEVMKGA